MRPSSSSLLLALVAAPLSDAAATDTKSACCAALAKSPDLQDKVYTPQNDIYSKRLATYYSANAAQAPWCMVMPSSTQDVSATVKILKDNNCPFGMRSGAHSAFEGANGIKDGVTVDFSYMNGTTYDKSTGLTSIQPGSTWELVYNTLDPYGVSAVGGRASVVGVGGFLSGGGYSFHTGKRGFACDSVDNFEVVLGDGSITNANAKENADLFKTLKGGSGNFGFITRIDQRVYESNMIWGGLQTYAFPDKKDALFDAYYNFVLDNEDDASQNLIACTYTKDGFYLASVLSNTDAEDAAPAFEAYRQIVPTSSSARVDHIAKLVPDFTGPTPLGLFANWMVGQTAHDRRVMDFINEKEVEYVAKIKAAAPGTDFEVLVQFQPVTKRMVEKSVQQGGNILGLEAVVADGPTLMWLIALTVDTAANQKIILPIALQFRDAINEYAEQLGVQRDWQFLNYAFKDQDPLLHYGAANVKLMKDVSQKYDPAQVFQKLRQTGFKLPA